MANRLPPTPQITQPGGISDLRSVVGYLGTLARGLTQSLSEIARVVNVGVFTDGTSTMLAPLKGKVYAKANLPSAATWAGGWVNVSDEAGGYTMAFSDGTNWRRVQDRVIVS